MRAKELNLPNSGFTLIELVTVMVLLATLATLAAPRFVHNDATLPAQAEQLARVLRHAQALAMSQGRALTVDIQPTTAYAITDGAPTPVTIRDPAGQLQAFTLSNGVTVTGPVLQLEFDTLGRPLDGANLADAARSWTLTSAGGSTASVNIQPLTGFVAVTP